MLSDKNENKVSEIEVDSSYAHSNESTETARPPYFKEMVKAKDHPKYSKFFKMLKVGISLEAIQQKISLEGLDPLVLDNGEAMLPLYLVGAQKNFLVGGFLSQNCSSQQIENLKDSVNFHFISFLEWRHSLSFCLTCRFCLVLLKDVEPLVPLQQHPTYMKFFKMSKIGISKEAVCQNMIIEGLDPDVLEQDPNKSVALLARRIYFGRQADH